MPPDRSDLALPNPLCASVAVRTLSTAQPHRFSITTSDAERASVAAMMGIETLDTLAFEGTIEVSGESAWTLRGRLSAMLTQLCVVTLDPIATSVDRAVTRRFEPGASDAAVIAVDFGRGIRDEDDAEDPDPPEPLGDEIDLAQILIEELALSIDPYPRKPDAPTGPIRHQAPGTDPLDEETLRPFAALAALRDRLGGTENQ